MPSNQIPRILPGHRACPLRSGQVGPANPDSRLSTVCSRQGPVVRDERGSVLGSSSRGGRRSDVVRLLGDCRRFAEFAHAVLYLRGHSLPRIGDGGEALRAGIVNSGDCGCSRRQACRLVGFRIAPRSERGASAAVGSVRSRGTSVRKNGVMSPELRPACRRPRGLLARADGGKTHDPRSP